MHRVSRSHHKPINSLILHGFQHCARHWETERGKLLQPAREASEQALSAEFGTGLGGEEQAAVGDLRRCIREDFPEEAISKLRPEAGGGVIWAMGRKAKASSEEPSMPWEGVWNLFQG